MKRYALAVLLLCAVGFGQTSDKAVVHVYRVKQIKGSAMRPSIYCDGNELTRLKNGTFITVNMPEGKHLFSSAKYVEDLPMREYVPGQEVFYKVNVAYGGWKLLEIDKDVAIQEMRGTKQLELTGHCQAK